MEGRLLKVRARTEVDRDDDARGVSPRKRTKLIAQACHAAKSVLPSRDATRNGSEKLVLLGLALLAVALAAVGASLSSHTVLRAYIEHSDQTFGLLSAIPIMLGPFALTALGTFAFSIGFLLLTKSSQSRLRQALVCPYCRDQVEQEGTLACVRKGCGALYHQECWDECAVQYGGCAIYGCSSKKAREVNAAAYVMRLSRLVVAAVLFPPRIARAIRDHRGDAFAGVYTRSLAQARNWHGLANASSGRQFVTTLLIGLPIAFILVLTLFDDRHGLAKRWLEHHKGAIPILSLALFYGIPFGLLALPFVVALLTALAFYGAKGVSAALANELGALTRADEGGGSVLGRLRAGLGGKKDCC